MATVLVVIKEWHWERWSGPQLPDGNAVAFWSPLLLLADLIPGLAWVPGAEISLP